MKKYKPVRPVNQASFEALGVSIDPKDIPKVKMDKSILIQKKEEKIIARQAAVKAAEDAFDQTHGPGV